MRILELYLILWAFVKLAVKLESQIWHTFPYSALWRIMTCLAAACNWYESRSLHLVWNVIPRERELGIVRERDGWSEGGERERGGGGGEEDLIEDRKSVIHNLVISLKAWYVHSRWMSWPFKVLMTWNSDSHVKRPHTSVSATCAMYIFCRSIVRVHTSTRGAPGSVM